MGNATYQQTNFTSGQVSELLPGRVDLSKYYNGVSVLDNYIVLKHGPIARRSGTKYVAETKSSQAASITNARLIPFQFSTDQTYQLEFGDSYVRIYLNRGRLLDDGTTKLVGADADSPFELESPYYQSFTPTSVSSMTHVVRGVLAGGVVSKTYQSDLGIVTINTTNPHGLAVGDFVLITNDNVGSNSREIEGVFPVLDVVDTDTFRYAKPTGGTTDAVAHFAVEMEDLVTVTFGSAHGIPVGAWITVTGAIPTEYNGSFRVRTVPSSTTLTYKLEGSPTSPATTVGTVTLVDMDVDKIKKSQSADVLFMAHPNVRPKELQRKNGFTVTDGEYDEDSQGRCRLVIGTAQEPHGFKAHQPGIGVYSKIIVTGMTPSEYNGCFNIDSVTDTSVSYTPDSAPAGAATVFGNVDGWQIVDYEYKDGPFLDQNVDEDNQIEIDSSATASPAKITFDKSSLNLNDRGRLFRQWNENGAGALIDWNWAEMIWITSATVARYSEAPRNPNGKRHPATDATKTDIWHLGAWSQALGWPRVVNFMQNRAMWAGNVFQPQAFWLTASDSIDDFEPTVFNGTVSQVADDNGINTTIDDNQVNAIYWLALTPQGMLIGTDSAEFLLQNRARFDPLTPSNLVVAPQSFLGSKDLIEPVRAGNSSILFVQKAGRKVFQMLYTFENDALEPKDITQLSEDITRGELEGLAFQQEPNPILWAYLSDGTLLGCTYEITEDVIGWHKHILGGTSAKVKSISVISDTSGDSPTDQLWMIVSRTVNGSTVEYIEYIEDAFETGDNLEDAFYLDSGFTYDGAATTTITGLDHLEGETVKVLADGFLQPDQTVSSGQITISTASKAQIGLSYTSRIATLPIEMRQAQPESSQKIKRPERAHVDFLNSQGVKFGMASDSLELVEFDDSVSLQTGPVNDMLLSSPYEHTHKLWIVQDSVYPTTIRSITIESEVQEIQG